MSSDRKIEHDRYSCRAVELMRRGEIDPAGSESVPQPLRAPYLHYDDVIRAVLRPGLRVLELAAGTGRHSLVAAEKGASLTCLDISAESLELASRRLMMHSRSARTVVSPMENMPLEDSSIDLVVCAGGLSYADPDKLDPEIHRVLAPGGSLICVDSLNHNPLYRLNRWTHWRLRGKRTRSTLVHMPTLERAERLGQCFYAHSIRCFGAFSWLWQPLSHVIGDRTATRLSSVTDRFPLSRRMAFKFVLEAYNVRK